MDINKLKSKLPVGWAEEAEAMDGARLRAAIVEAEAAIREAEDEQKKDEKLQGAKELVKDLLSGYNDVKRAQRAKIAYSLYLLEARGEL